MVNPQMPAKPLLERGGDNDLYLNAALLLRGRMVHSSERSINTSKETQDFDHYFKLVGELSAKIQNEIEGYWSILQSVPIAVMLVFCIEKSKGGNPIGNYLYSLGINRLWSSRLLPVENQGKSRVLGDFHSDEHIQVVENIRCHKMWGLLEKEELVNCYIQFSYDLARFTFGMFPPAFDPDRLRVERKAVKYEVFIDFIQLLSERDAVMAKLLYFGAPSIDEVISLKISALDMVKLEIKFGERSIRFPKHLMRDIEAYTHPRKEMSEGLVFVNLRGGAVERVHLNQAFARASLKLNEVFKFTPAVLLKSV